MIKQRTDDVPPTEPKNVAATATTAMIEPDRAPRVAGSRLVPDLDKNRASILTRYYFWLGVTPNCPTDGIDVCGVGFPKLTETVQVAGQTTRRIPVVGHIVQLGEAEIRRLSERLPRTVIRMYADKTRQELLDEAGVGLSVADSFTRKRRGQVLTIPREQDIKTIEAAGRPAHRYEQGPLDQPAARYMFAVLCDQQNPRAGATYPETLEKAGLPWPFPGAPPTN